MMNSRPTRKPEGRGPFLKLRRMIAGVAASKPFLITVSALAAIVCWSALVASDGTLTRQKVFANVAVSVTGDAALKSRGYIVMDDILEEVPAVKMTVEVTQSNYNRVSDPDHGRGRKRAGRHLFFPALRPGRFLRAVRNHRSCGTLYHPPRARRHRNDRGDAGRHVS